MHADSTAGAGAVHAAATSAHALRVYGTGGK
jgi:hypothetical protein